MGELTFSFQLTTNEDFAVMTTDIPDVCNLVLQKIFGSGLENYSITVRGTGIPGEGFNNDMVFLDLSHGEEHISLAIKIMPDIKNADRREFVSRLYDTEILFYEKIWPTLYEFQKDNLKNKLFDKIPKYFGSSSENGRRLLVLENLKSSDFLLLDKTHMYDKDLVEMLFKNFGNYHALSLAFKDKHPDEFENLINLLPKNSWNKFKNVPLFSVALPILSKIATSLVEDGVIKDKMSAFANRIVLEFDEMTTYKGDYNVVRHGDCFINNFMFNLNESGNLQDVRFIDFQVADTGTPVQDLVYTFYAGATKEILDELEHYLQVYHSSLSSKLREFGCDPDKLYSYDILKIEWKQYAKFGCMMSLLYWRTKFGNGITDVMERATFESPLYLDGFDKGKYAQFTGDLIQHMFQNNFI